MESPIIAPSTLTEEQKEAIRILYMYAETDRAGSNEFVQFAGYANVILLEELFGVDFFKEE